MAVRSTSSTLPHQPNIVTWMNTHPYLDILASVDTFAMPGTSVLASTKWILAWMSHLFCVPSHGLVVNPAFLGWFHSSWLVLFGPSWALETCWTVLLKNVINCIVYGRRVYMCGEILLFLIFILTFKYNNYMTTLVFKSLELVFIVFKNLYSSFQCHKIFQKSFYAYLINIPYWIRSSTEQDWFELQLVSNGSF